MADPARPDIASASDARFVTQAHAVEDRLKADTVGLVQLSDFRKRRAEAFEAAQDTGSGGSTPNAGYAQSTFVLRGNADGKSVAKQHQKQCSRRRKRA
jgi:protein FAM50